MTVWATIMLVSVHLDNNNVIAASASAHVLNWTLYKTLWSTCQCEASFNKQGKANACKAPLD